MNDTASAVDPLQPHCLAESVIPTLLLPQATSARHAVELLGGYMATNGASEANGVLLSDPEEVWYFEIGSHRHWIAVRIPDDAFLVVANQMRVHDVDLDAEDVLHSPGLFEFVVDCGLLTNADRSHFNFAKAFGALGDPYNTNREWLAQWLLKPSLDQRIDLEQYPLFLTPDDEIAPAEVMGVLTAVYEGTPFVEKLAALKASGADATGYGERPIGYWKTGESHIITLDAAAPDPLKGTIWQAISTPLCAPYIPLPAAMTSVPRCYHAGTDDYGVFSAYWANRGLYTLAHTAGAEALAGERATWRSYEADLIAEHDEVRDAMIAMAEADPAAAQRFAEHYGTGVALSATDQANRRRNALMTELANRESVSPGG